MIEEPVVEVQCSDRNFLNCWWIDKVSRKIGKLPHLVEGVVEDCVIKEPLAAIREAVAKSKVTRLFKEASTQGLDDWAGAHVLYHRTTPNAVLDVMATHDVFAIHCWTDDVAEASKVMHAILEHAPQKPPITEESGIVPIAFWRRGQHGGEFAFRDLQCPHWKEITANYSEQIRCQVNELVAMEHPDEVGKIVLWHGPPGTGKTYCIRGLAREWFRRLGATIEVILDPEVLFAQAGYMYEVLLASPQNNRVYRRVRHRIIGPGQRRNDEHLLESTTEQEIPLRLVVIEDYARLFSAECRNTEGFARLLNLSDGLLGQGIRVIFLLTANEKIDYIDPAVLRPGRCIQTVYFDVFRRDEAKRWLVEQTGHEDWLLSEKQETFTLAELYAVLHDREPAAQVEQKVGFA